MADMLSKIKQPSPSVSNKEKNETIESGGKKYKIRPASNVGNFKPARVTKTPLTDWVEIKRKENPHTIYKIKSKKDRAINIHTIAGLSIIGCAVASILKLIKK